MANIVVFTGAGSSLNVARVCRRFFSFYTASQVPVSYLRNDRSGEGYGNDYKVKQYFPLRQHCSQNLYIC